MKSTSRFILSLVSTLILASINDFSCVYGKEVDFVNYIARQIVFPDAKVDEDGFIDLDYVSSDIRFDEDSFKKHPRYQEISNYVANKTKNWSKTEANSPINKKLVYVRYDSGGKIAISKKVNPIFDHELVTMIQKFAEYSYIVSVRARDKEGKVYYINKHLHDLSLLENEKKLADGSTFKFFTNDERFEIIAIAPIVPTIDGTVWIENTPAHVVSLVLDKKNQAIFVIVSCRGSQGTNLGADRGEEYNRNSEAGIFQQLLFGHILPKSGIFDISWEVNFNAASKLAGKEYFGVDLDVGRGFYSRFVGYAKIMQASVNAFLSLVPENMRDHVKFLPNGHSQGGALATLTAVCLANKYKNLGFSENHVWAYLLSAARVIRTSEMLLKYYKILDSENIVNHSSLFDIVTCVSPGENSKNFNLALKILGFGSDYFSVGQLAREDVQELHEKIFKYNIKACEIKKSECIKETNVLFEKLEKTKKTEDEKLIEDKIIELKNIIEKSLSDKSLYINLLKKTYILVDCLNNMYEIQKYYKENKLEAKDVSKMSWSEYLESWKTWALNLYKLRRTRQFYYLGKYMRILKEIAIAVNHFGALHAYQLTEPLEAFFKEEVVSKDINQGLSSGLDHQNLEIK